MQFCFHAPQTHKQPYNDRFSLKTRIMNNEPSWATHRRSYTCFVNSLSSRKQLQHRAIPSGECDSVIGACYSPKQRMQSSGKQGSYLNGGIQLNNMTRDAQPPAAAPGDEAGAASDEDAGESASLLPGNRPRTALAPAPGGRTGGLGIIPKWMKMPVTWPVMVSFCTIAIFICYADRSNISTAIIYMSEEFHWDKSTQGVILGAFFWGYAATQLLGGHAADTLGGKHILGLGVALWSVCTFLTPGASAAGVGVLLVARIALGLGEGIAFPAVHALIARGVPTRYQSTSVAVITAASYMGTAFAFGVTPSIISGASWEWAFYLFGGSAVLWLPIWAVLELPQQTLIRAGSAPALQGAPGGPAGTLGTLDDERADSRVVEGDVEGGTRQRKGPAGNKFSPGLLLRRSGASESPSTGFWALMRTREVQAICVAQYTGSWGLYGLLSWLPTFFEQKYHVELSELGSYTLLPYVVQGIVGASSGILADNLISRGYHIRTVRRWLQVVGMLGPAVCLVAAASPLTEGAPSTASLFVTIGLGFSALTLGAVSVSHLDVAPNHAGTIFAAGNTAATLAGLIGVPLTGVILDATNSWLLVFGVTALHYVVGAAVWYTWVGDKQLPQDQVVA